MSTAFDLWRASARVHSEDGLSVGGIEDALREAFAAGERMAIRRDKRLEHLVTIAAGLAASRQYDTSAAYAADAATILAALEAHVRDTPPQPSA